MEKSAVKILFAKDFGVDGDPATDDTDAIQKTFDAARKMGNCLVIFPGSIFKLSKTIQLPNDVTVRGAGMTVFVQENPVLDIFHVEDARKIGFKNCTFEGGRNGISIATRDSVAARIGFEECNFFDQNNIGIQCLAGDDKIEKTNHTELLFERGSLASVQGAVTNAEHSQFNTFWPANDPRLDNNAYIENRGGAMRVQNMLAVPMLWQGKRSDKTPASIKNWPYSQNTRWFDNWGQIYVLDSRFGGEGGGMCNIYNKSANGTIYVNGGITRFVNGATKMAMLYFEVTPKVTVLQNISTRPYSIDGSSLILQPNGPLNPANIFLAGVMYDAFAQ